MGGAGFHRVSEKACLPGAVEQRARGGITGLSGLKKEQEERTIDGGEYFSGELYCKA